MSAPTREQMIEAAAGAINMAMHGIAEPFDCSACADCATAAIDALAEWLPDENGIPPYMSHYHDVHNFYTGSTPRESETISLYRVKP